MCSLLDLLLSILNLKGEEVRNHYWCGWAHQTTPNLASTSLRKVSLSLSLSISLHLLEKWFGGCSFNLFLFPSTHAKIQWQEASHHFHEAKIRNGAGGFDKEELVSKCAKIVKIWYVDLLMKFEGAHSTPYSPFYIYIYRNPTNVLNDMPSSLLLVFNILQFLGECCLY